MIFYNIHNMVSVQVEAGVSSLIVNAIDLQIGYFRQNEIPKTLYQIVVKPYDTLINVEYFSQEFLLYEGGNEYLILHSLKLGIAKVDTGYCVYAENPNIPLIHLIQYLLLRCGCTIIHGGAAIDKDGKGVLMPGVAGVGKTTLLIHLVRNFKYSLIGDDYVILSKEGLLYSFPKKYVTIKSHLLNEKPEIYKAIEPPPLKRYINRLKKFTAQNAPFRGVFEGFLLKEGIVGNIVRSFSVRSDYHVSIRDVYGAENLVESGEVNQIIYLQKHISELSLTPLTEESMCNRIIASTHNEWTKSIKILFGLSSVEKGNVLAYFNDIENIIRSGIKGKNCQLLRIPDRVSAKEVYIKIKEFL